MQILQLPSEGSFEVPMLEQLVQMLNEMGYNPQKCLISSFKKSNLPSLWNIFFNVTLLCLTGRNSGLYKTKLQFYSVLASLCYGMNVNNASSSGMSSQHISSTIRRLLGFPMLTCGV